MNGITSERTNAFKYLKVELRADKNNHREIQQRINTTNRCLFDLKPVLNFKFDSLKTKIILYKVMIYTIVLYASETWTTTISDEQKVAIFEKKVLRYYLDKKKKNRSTGL